jgi:hypothetical protein
MMAHPVNRKIAELARTLRAVQRVIQDIRDSEFESYTIPPDRSFDHMNDHEKRVIRRYDRLLKKIDLALR